MGKAPTGSRQASVIDRLYMTEALKEARTALEQGEVPVGAVITHRRQLVGRAHHQTHALKDPTAHAAMIAITQAATAVGDRWLAPAAVYVTAKPCRMCEGALALAGVEQVVYGAGATAPKPPASTSTGRALASECDALLTAYRRRRRQRKQLTLS